MPSCFFIGHRDAPESLLPKVRVAAEGLILREGVTDFYVGSRGSFDRLAAAVVRELMEEYPQVRLYRVLAYLPAKGTGEMLGFTGTVFPEGLESTPRRFAIERANRAMVDRCDYLIAYAPFETGNARKVLDYAIRRRGRGLIRIIELKANGK
jgi:hypothetical protein